MQTFNFGDWLREKQLSGQSNTPASRMEERTARRKEDVVKEREKEEENKNI